MTCQAELRGLGAINDELEALGVRVVAVSVDPPTRSAEVVRRGRLPFPILADEEGRMIRAMGLLHKGGGPGGGDIAIPAQVLIGQAGDVLWERVADRIQDRPDPQTTMDDVAGVLRARGE